MGNRILAIVVLSILAVCLLGGVALAYSYQVTLPAYNPDGRGGTMIGNHVYQSYSSTQWNTTQFNYRVINNTRASNNVNISLKSNGVSVWQSEDGSVVGEGPVKYKYPNAKTLKNSTTCYWLFIADVNNATDPRASTTIGPI